MSREREQGSRFASICIFFNGEDPADRVSQAYDPFRIVHMGMARNVEASVARAAPWEELAVEGRTGLRARGHSGRPPLEETREAFAAVLAHLPLGATQVPWEQGSRQEGLVKATAYGAQGR